MQDIVFYVAAKETLGKVRDYSNMRNSDAPLLTLGVAVCLRMRLFDDIEVSTPYPIASFNSITDWQWSMDDDFNRSTACTLVADAGGISVHSVTDTVNGETMSFTEFVIRISNMNTEKLAAWLGSEGTKSGLTGELVGYDNGGHAVFVLQIEDFSVRNRVAGLGDPTALDQEIVTRTQAEQMIQTAVSASAAMKQDKLNSGNAGTGITISSAGVISTENVPQSAVTGLAAALSSKQNALSKGFWIEIDDDWISVERYHTIHGPYLSGSVAMQPGEAYKIYATNAAVTLDASNIPSNKWGVEGHAEIFVANTGYIHTTSRVVLANALEPDAVNNCTVRFHDGLAIISVEDHVAGYIVTVNAGTTAGSLYYGLATASNEYISIDASLNGQTLDLGGATTNGEKHIVGNGYTETIISGGINCTSKTTFSNLGMNGVVVSSGTLTLGNVYIPPGATVAVGGGGLAVEKVTGNGGVIDLGQTSVFLPLNSSAAITGATITNGKSAQGAFNVFGATVSFDSCYISGNKDNSNAGRAMLLDVGAVCNLSDTIFADDQAVLLYANYGSGCTVNLNGGNSMALVSGGNFSVNIANSNTIKEIAGTDTAPSTVTIESGAIVDLAGNMNATPIAPGGDVVFEQGGATVYPSAGQASAYMLGGMKVHSLTNTAIIGGTVTVVTSGAVASGGIFSSAAIDIPAQKTAVISGATITDNIDLYGDWRGKAIQCGGIATLDNCVFDSCNRGALYVNNPDGGVTIKGGTYGATANIATYGVVSFEGNVAFMTTAGALGTGGFVISSGAILDLTGNTNSIAVSGGSIVIPAGAVVQIGDMGDNNDYKAFGGITGSSIDSHGWIGGATISLPARASCTYLYMLDGQEHQATATGPADIVVPGQLSYCGD